MANILITAPSLNEMDNVSGISSVVRGIISFNKNDTYYHFILGKKDKDRKGLIWLIKQLLIIPKLFWYFINFKVDILHLNTGFEKASLIRDFVIFKIAKLFNKTVLFHAHGGYYLMQPPKRSSKIYNIINSILNSSDAVIVLTEVEKQQLSNVFDFSKAIVIPNAINIPSKKRAETKNDNLINVSFLGRVVKEKGIFEIAEAFSKMTLENISKIRFLVYGAGPDIEKFIVALNQVKNLNYSYEGIITGEDKWDALYNTDIFLLPSYFEGLPMAMLEAMACGCACIVTNDASITSVVKNNENGIVISKKDSGMLQNSMTYLIDNKYVTEKIGSAATQTIIDNYSMQLYITRLTNVYRQLI
jgi:glycosyltransferase involved in cell wall biosynthesis